MRRLLDTGTRRLQGIKVLSPFGGIGVIPAGIRPATFFEDVRRFVVPPEGGWIVAGAPARPYRREV